MTKQIKKKRKKLKNKKRKLKNNKNKKTDKISNFKHCYLILDLQILKSQINQEQFIETKMELLNYRLKLKRKIKKKNKFIIV